jgi:hypothetical protein
MIPPLNTPEAYWIAQILIEPLTIQVLGAICQAYIPMCRANMSFREFVDTSRGYKSGRLHTGDIPWRYLGELDDIIFEMNNDLQPTGERVPLEDFCKLAQNVSNGIVCSVCMAEVNKDNKDEEQPVITKCAHYFHKVCLDSWVNESGMNGANACPQCRTEMCQARARRPVSQIEEATQETEEHDIINSIEEDALYAEGNTDREKSFFSRLRSRFRRAK